MGQLNKPARCTSKGEVNAITKLGKPSYKILVGEAPINGSNYAKPKAIYPQNTKKNSIIHSKLIKSSYPVVVFSLILVEGAKSSPSSRFFDELVGQLGELLHSRIDLPKQSPSTPCPILGP